MSDQIISRQADGNAVFHIGLKPDGTLQPIINAVLPFGNIELLKCLLQTDRPGGQFLDLNDETGYFFVYDNARKKPYPSVIIWKYRKEGDVRVIENVGKENLSIIQYAVDTYLR